MTNERTIKTIANEILQFKGKCNTVDVQALSKKLLGLDENLEKYQSRQLKRDEPKGA
jgi:hypothetical protein